jgi:hypothetical protein
MRALLSLLSKIGIVVAIAAVFIIGMAGTVYLSLLSPEVSVPKIVGKDRARAEEELKKAGLRMQERARRYSKEADPDTVLDQSPRPDEVVKTGQTIAVVLSKGAPETASNQKSDEEKEKSSAKDDSKKDSNKNAKEDSSKEKSSERRRKPTKKENSEATTNTNVNVSNTEGTKRTQETSGEDRTADRNRRSIPTFNQRENPSVP